MLRMTKCLSAAIGLSMSLATPSAPVLANELRVEHAKGETVLMKAPAKVAVFDLAALDILATLGVDAVAGVPKGASGTGNFPGVTATFGDPDYRNVGTLFEPDLSALETLKPDLVIVGGRSSRKYETVSAIAPTIDLSPGEMSLATAAVTNTRKLGAVFGVQDKADQAIAKLEASLAGLHAASATAGTGLVLFAAGGGVSVHAPGDRFGTVYDFVGIKPAVAPAQPSPSGPRPKPGSAEAQAAAAKRDETLRAALAASPDWLLVLDRTAATSSEPSTIVERLGADPRIAATDAWKKGRVIYLDPKAWYLVGAGISSLTASAEDIRAAMKKAQ
jgi:iron complex transport system substrate-binding protein